MKEAIFIGFSLLSILSAVGVVVARQAIFSAFSLVMAFFGLAGLYVVWGSDLIGMLQILIYTGAIVVLFVFVVMLLDLREAGRGEKTSILTLILGGGAVWAFSLIALRTLNRASFFVSADPPVADNTKKVAHLLFSHYLWPFEILSIFLLVLIVSVCVIARPNRTANKNDRGAPV